MKHKTLLAKLTMLVLLAAVLAGCSGLGKPAFHGEVYKPTELAADINMPDQNGNTFQLSKQHGKIVLVFFGFLNCPDECPLTMTHLKQALEMLGDNSKNVQVVLVSTDPVRDTPQAMKAYLANFNPTFLGITGTKDQLQKIWEDYGVMVLDGGETHSAYTYVIDQSGNLRLALSPEMNPDEIAADLEILLSE